MRSVEQILHFTTDKGVLGSLHRGELLSRKRVQDDPDLAFIFNAVWPRKDHAWLDHVSLSVNRINLDLWEAAVQKLPDRWWTVLSFDIAILDHEGVWFATTNNIYPACLRARGPEGFEALFAERVHGRYSVEHTRIDLPPSQPTDRAAEVLYPRGVSLEYLRAVWVGTEAHRRLVRAWCEALGRPAPEISVRPDAFE